MDRRGYRGFKRKTATMVTSGAVRGTGAAFEVKVLGDDEEEHREEPTAQ